MIYWTIQGKIIINKFYRNIMEYQNILIGKILYTLIKSTMVNIPMAFYLIYYNTIFLNYIISQFYNVVHSNKKCKKLDQTNYIITPKP